MSKRYFWLVLFILLVLSSLALQVNKAKAQEETPTRTSTPTPGQWESLYKTPTPWATPHCPTGTPIYYGIKTPSSNWLYYCSHCLPKLTYPTSTPIAPTLTSTITPTLNPSITVTPSSTPTRTPSPTPTQYPLLEFNTQNIYNIDGYTRGVVDKNIKVNNRRFRGAVSMLYGSSEPWPNMRVFITFTNNTFVCEFKYRITRLMGRVSSEYGTSDALGPFDTFIDWSGRSYNLTLIEDNGLISKVYYAKVIHHTCVPVLSMNFRLRGHPTNWYTVMGDYYIDIIEVNGVTVTGEQPTPTPLSPNNYCLQVEGIEETQPRQIGIDIPGLERKSYGCFKINDAFNYTIIGYTLSLPSITACFWAIRLTDINVLGIIVNLNLIMIAMASYMVIRWITRS